MGRDGISMHQAYEGSFSPSGELDRGKSSTLQHLMLALMRCNSNAVPHRQGRDFATIAKLAMEVGRGADLVRFAPEEDWRFDFSTRRTGDTWGGRGGCSTHTGSGGFFDAYQRRQEQRTFLADCSGSQASYAA